MTLPIHTISTHPPTTPTTAAAPHKYTPIGGTNGAGGAGGFTGQHLEQ
jgi:hypothetical protein